MERSALQNFRSGSVKQALAAYDQHGRIERVATLPEVRAGLSLTGPPPSLQEKQAIMLAGRREDARALNLLAREALPIGRLQGPTLSVDGVPFQVGDQVLTLRNNKRLDVHNGERGTVERIDRRSRSMVVRMGERVVTLPPEYLEAGHVSHGYAMTVHKAQGVTVDRAFMLGTDDLYREMGYVAMSRGRNGNHLYPSANRFARSNYCMGRASTGLPKSCSCRHCQRAAHRQWQARRSIPSRLFRTLRSRPNTANFEHGSPPSHRTRQRGSTEVKELFATFKDRSQRSRPGVIRNSRPVARSEMS